MIQSYAGTGQKETFPSKHNLLPLLRASIVGKVMKSRVVTPMAPVISQRGLVESDPDCF